MDWQKQSPTGTTAQQITESTYGATYCDASGDTIRTLVTSETDHAIVTWRERRRIWQYWHRDADGRWHFLDEFTSSAKAREEAEGRRDVQVATAELRNLPAETALTVIAEWDSTQGLHHGNRPMKVSCSSPYTGEVIAGVFRRLGCKVRTEIAA